MQTPETPLEKAKGSIQRIQDGNFSLLDDEIKIIEKNMNEHPEIEYLLPFKTNQNFQQFSKLYYILGYTKALAAIFYDKRHQTKKVYDIVVYFKEMSGITDVSQLGYDQRELNPIFRAILESEDEQCKNHASNVTELLTSSNQIKTPTIEIDPNKIAEEKDPEIAKMYFKKMKTSTDPNDSYKLMLKEMRDKELSFADLDITETDFNIAVHDAFKKYATELTLSAKDMTEKEQNDIIPEINAAYQIAGIDEVITEFPSNSEKTQTSDNSNNVSISTVKDISELKKPETVSIGSALDPEEPDLSEDNVLNSLLSDADSDDNMLSLESPIKAVK